jgi:hypothetical protein
MLFLSFYFRHKARIVKIQYPMKKVVTSVSTFGLLFLLLTVPALLSSSSHAGDIDLNLSNNSVSTLTESVTTPLAKARVIMSAVLYDSMQLKRHGLSKNAFEVAYKGYEQLLKKGSIARENILSICDFSQSSRRKRFYIIDLKEKKVLINTYVAHGRNSGAEYASSFSNSPESHKSSLGFYVTNTTYQGGHGLSLRITGVEKNINDKAYDRNIVVHGSDYVGGEFIKNNPFNGRSYGCPAVPAKQTNEVIQTIKNGSCLFIYHPNKKYMKESKLLNG